jgi:uncharacterized membrane protein YfcA
VSLLSLLAILIVSFLAGMTNAVAGGGTFLTFPALTGLRGLSEKVANMTSTIGLWPGAAASVVAAKRELARLPRGMTVAFSVISLIGGILGAWLLRVTTVATFKLAVPWLLLFATVIFAFSKPIARWAGRGHGGRTMGWTILVGCVQLGIAIYGGYFGAGMSILMLAGLSFAGLDDIHQMNGMKVLMSAVCNGAASFMFLFSGQVNWRLALPMAAFSAVGGFLGITIARKVPQAGLRVLILIIAAALTVIYFVKSYGV